MKIGELAKKVGLSVSKVRYYETLGIIRAKRKDSNYREFPPEAERLLILVLQAKDLGFTLKEIKSLATALQQQALTKDKSLRKTKRPFPDSSLAARARRALLNEGFPGKPYVA